MEISSITIQFEDIITEDLCQIPEITVSLNDGTVIAQATPKHEPQEFTDTPQFWSEIAEDDAARDEYITKILNDHHYDIERILKATLELIDHLPEVANSLEKWAIMERKY